MKKPIQILLQTTIPETLDDWHIGRFSLLREFLATNKDQAGNSLCHVTTRNRESADGSADPILSTLDNSVFDELWLFAVDTGQGLTTADCQGITRFRQRGGGILATRDHQDLGSSLCTLGGVGRAHYFHTQNPEPDESRRVSDDAYTKSISWPNYHSGRNGDYQKITATEPLHELLRSALSPSGMIEYFPAHPHEGAVGTPADENGARVVATGLSKVTGRPFNLLVAFDQSADSYGNKLGRAVAESSFHHFVDYNWDTSKGCPSFLEEPPGDGLKKEPEKLEGFKVYIRNLALWLAAPK
ncbi:MAG TPA: hypothetical protein VK210_02075 [Terriglobia bacterium]|nr:hypothetical protein [Terriglobia bacterium]